MLNKIFNLKKICFLQMIKLRVSHMSNHVYPGDENFIIILLEDELTG